MASQLLINLLLIVTQLENLISARGEPSASQYVAGSNIFGGKGEIWFIIQFV